MKLDVRLIFSAPMPELKDRVILARGFRMTSRIEERVRQCYGHFGKRPFEKLIE